jgi:DNA ligase D-like protein (predicted 3'-phosphoesterase)
MTYTHLDPEFLARVQLRFVVKMHHATRLHFDVRFEYVSPHGILELASFVIIEGPSLDPTINLCAIRVADHDVRYMESERVIPPGKYGAGPMLVWDIGQYIAFAGDTGLRVDLATALRDGFVVIELKGKKLNGRFELRFVRKYYQEEWSFRKMQDDEAIIGSNIVEEQPNSVLTNRSLEEVRAGISARRKRDDMTGTLLLARD